MENEKMMVNYHGAHLSLVKDMAKILRTILDVQVDIYCKGMTEEQKTAYSKLVDQRIAANGDLVREMVKDHRTH